MGSPALAARASRALTLAFRFGPIPVRVHIWFVLLSLLLGLGAQRGPAGIAASAGGFFVTVLAHELAHAFAARSFGVPAEVQLTLFRPGLGLQIALLSPLRRAAVYLAGPALSLSLAAIILPIARAYPAPTDVHAGVLRYLGWINLGWGLLNLLPILPLDAGHALVAILDRATNGRGEQPARWLSIGFAAVLGLVAIHFQMTFLGFLSGIVAFQNAQALRGLNAKNRESIARARLQAAFEAIERGETRTVVGHCRAVLSESTRPEARREAVRLLAYAYASTEAWGELMEVLESGGLVALEDGELERYERAARELGRSEEARRIALLRGRVA